MRAGKIEQTFIEGSTNTVAKCRSNVQRNLWSFVSKKTNATYIDHGSL